MRKNRKKKAMTKAKFEAEMERLKLLAPRVGVINTKVVPDKTNYTRKKKHRYNAKSGD